MSRERPPDARAVAASTRAPRASRAACGFVLVAVLVVLAIAFAVVAGMVLLARGDAAIAVTHERAAQSRSLGWSGVQAVGVLLDRQRDRMLAGESPRLDRQLVIYETPSTLGVVRLLPVGADDDGEASLLRAEGGRLDLNRVDAPGLVATGLVDSTQAAAVVAARSAAGGRFLSEAELFAVEALSPELLVGSLEALAWAADAGRRGDDADRAPPPRSSAPAAPPAPGETPVEAAVEADGASGVGDAGGIGVRASAGGLLDVVTVYAIEPMLRRDGSPRQSLAAGWSEGLQEQATRDFGAEFATALEALLKAGAPAGDGALVKALRQRSVPASAWGEMLDAYTAEPASTAGGTSGVASAEPDAGVAVEQPGVGWIAGRVDLNSAPYEAILAIPSITPQQAAEIVRLRDDLAAEERWTPTWPVLRGIVTEAQYETLVEHVTTRCFLWRVRLAAGETPADDPDAPLSNAVVWEAVIDLTTPSWRIAYLRDSTLLPLAAALLSAAPEEEPSGEPTDGADPGGATASSGGSTTGDAARDIEGSDAFDGAEPPADESVPEPEAPPEERLAPPEAPSITPPLRPGAGSEGGASPNLKLDSKPGVKPNPKQSAPRGPAPVGRWRT